MKKRSMEIGQLIFCMTFIFCVNGCASISFYKVPVQFGNPLEDLAIIETEPQDEEKTGILLRLNPSKSGKHIYKEETILFSGIENDIGRKVLIEKTEIDTYSPNAREGSYHVDSETQVKGEHEQLALQYESNTRGEVLSFISGEHRSSFGTFQILDWKRTPLFPEEKVSIGDTWKYTEELDMRIKSFLVSDTDPHPSVIHGTSTLVGFTEIHGRRCAVIETTVNEIQEWQLKILFKKVHITVNAHIVERTYLDYVRDEIVAKIITTESFTESDDLGLRDRGRGQGMVYLVEQGEE